MTQHLEPIRPKRHTRGPPIRSVGRCRTRVCIPAVGRSGVESVALTIVGQLLRLAYHLPMAVDEYGDVEEVSN